MVEPEATRRLREELVELESVRREIDETLAGALGELGIEDEVARAVIYDRRREELIRLSDAGGRSPKGKKG